MNFSVLPLKCALRLIGKLTTRNLQLELATNKVTQHGVGLQNWT